MTDHDLVIRNGTVVDGTGGPSRTASIAVDNGRVSVVGRVDGRGEVELDATGLLVTPGWVDVHTHYDGQVTWDDTLAPSSWQGVTTVVMGNCGVGFAPVTSDRRDWLIQVMEGIEDIPGTALHEGITWAWETYPQYLDAIDTPHAIDFGAMVPHGAVRGYVMGDRGADHTEIPTAEEIARMGQIVADGVAAGALGFSTSRTVAHRAADGRHTPTLTAGHDELLGIAAAMGTTGRGTIGLVADLFDLDVEWSLVRGMAEVSGRPVTITVLQRPDFPADEYRRILDRIAEANADGLTITGQVASRPVGLIMSLEGRVHPLVMSPTYQSLAALPLPERVERLRTPEVRDSILTEVRAGGVPMSDRMMFALTDPPRYDPSPSDALDLDAAYDVLLSHDGNGRIYVPVMNFVEGDLRATRAMIVDEHTVPGLGDAGAHCTMICDGSFPTHWLQYWGRDAAADDRLPVEWLVKQHTADTAAVFGLTDRGVLAPGMRADINVIDLDALAIGVPEMLHDLPAGGKRLVQRARGYRATIVSGEVVSIDGQLTTARPGRLVRSGAAGR